MAFMGGGFFGSGASSTSAETNATQATQAGYGSGSQLNLSGFETRGRDADNNVTINMTDSGAVSGALNLAGGSVGAVLDFASRALSDTAALSYDGVSLAADVLNNAAYLNYDGLNSNVRLTGDVLTAGATQSLAVLSSAENFADLSALLSLEHTKMSHQQAQYAMDYTAKENDANRALVYDAMGQVGDAWMAAGNNMTAFAYDAMAQMGSAYDRANQNVANVAYDANKNLAKVQSDALHAINTNSVASQSASMKALDYVFEASKTAEERTIKDSTKWLVGGIVAVAGIFIFPSLAKALK